MTEDTTQIAQVVSDVEPDTKKTSKATVVEVQDGVYNSADTFVKQITSVLPQYKYDNILSLRGRLATDEEFLNKLTQEMVTKTVLSNKEQSTFYQQNPAKYLELQNSTKNFIRSSVTSEVIVGETLKESVNRRAMDVDFSNPSIENVGIYRNEILKNKDKYLKYGLIDGDNIAFDDSKNGNYSLFQAISKNPELSKQIYSDRYDSFLSSVNKLHNKGAIDQTNPDEIGESYAVWDKFGEEGLTQYLNFKQGYDSNLLLSEQSEKVKTAYDFVKNAKFGGKKIEKHVSDFFGEKGTDNSFSIVPVKQSIETKVNIPKDLNNYTSYNYNEGIKSLITKVKKESDSATTNFFERLGFDELSLFPQSKELEFKDDIKKLPKEERRKLLLSGDGSIWKDNVLYSDVTIDEIVEDLNNNTDSKNYRKFVQNLYNEAASGDLGFTVEDLVKTIASNASNTKELENGATQFIIHYDTARQDVKLAIDALRSDTMGLANAITEDKDYIYFEPDYATRLNAEPKPNKQVTTIYGDGEDFTDENEGIINGSLNFLAGASKGVMQVSYDLIGKHAERAALDILKNRINVNTLPYEQNVRPNFTSKELNTNDSVAEISGNVIGMLGSYLYAGVKLGKGDTGKIFKSLQNIRTNTTNRALSSLLNGGRVSKAINKGVEISNKNSKFFTSLDMELGFAKLELIGGKENSLIYNLSPSPLTNDELSSGYTENSVLSYSRKLKEFYSKNSRPVQAAMDLIAAETLSIFFDNAIGAFKYGKDFAKKANKESVKALKLNKFTLQDEYVKSPEFRGDLYQILRNVFDGDELYKTSDKITNEMVSNSMKKVMSGGQVENVVDLVNRFKVEGDDYMVALRNDIEDNLRQVLENDQTSSKVKTTPELLEANKIAIEEQTELIYQNTIKTLAKGFNDAFEFAGLEPEYAHTLANAMLLKSNSFKTVLNSDNKPYFNISEAVEQQRKYPFSVIKEVEDGKYIVLENTPSVWQKELSAEIKKGIKKQETEEGVRTKQDVMSSIKNESSSGLVSFTEDGEQVYGKVVKKYKNGDVAVTFKNKSKIVKNDNYEEVVEEMSDDSVTKADYDMEADVENSEYLAEIDKATRLKKLKDEAVPSDKKPRKRKIVNSVEEVKKQVDNDIEKAVEEEKLVSILDQVVESANASVRANFETVENVVVKDKKTAKHGVDETLVKQVMESSDYEKVGQKEVRKVVKILGGGKNTDLEKIGRNVGPIEEFDPSKVGENGIPVDTIVKVNGEPFIVTKKLPSGVSPSVFVYDKEKSKLIFNPYTKRILQNATVNSDGTLKKFKSVLIDGKVWYEESLDGSGVFLNIQKPLKISGITKDTGKIYMEGVSLTLDEAHLRGIDAVYDDSYKQRRYLVVNNDQVIEPNKIKNMDTKTTNKSVEVLDDCKPVTQATRV